MKLLGCGANANSYAFDSKVHGWIQCQSPRQRTRGAIALVWTFMFLPNSYVAILIPNGMELGGGAFGNCWCHGGGVLRKGINTLLKETRRTPLPFHLVRTQGEDCDPEQSPSLFTIMSSAEILKKYACLFSCFIVITRSPSLALSKSVYSRHPYLVPNFWKNVSSLQH